MKIKQVYAFYTMGKTTFAKKHGCTDNDRFYPHPHVFGQTNLSLTNQLSPDVKLVILPDDLQTVYQRIKNTEKEDFFNQYPKLLEEEYQQAQAMDIPIIYLKPNQYLEHIKERLL